MAAYLRETADAWNASIERWTYVTGTDLARQVGVDGYYVRIAPPDLPDGGLARAMDSSRSRTGRRIRATAPADQIVSPDALALVRFGLRSADDPRIVNTVKVIDALLKVETPVGPGLASLQRATATASMPTARPSTAPASGAPGRC